MQHMITVPVAAERVGRDPETIRRWIRAGKLSSRKVGTQHLVDERELDAIAGDRSEMLPLPQQLRRTATGQPMPNIVAVVHQSRRGR
jgi:excisionase family DNA binding protein